MQTDNAHTTISQFGIGLSSEWNGAAPGFRRQGEGMGLYVCVSP